jgi:hypothetical protein
MEEPCLEHDVASLGVVGVVAVDGGNKVVHTALDIDVLQVGVRLHGWVWC